MSNSMRWRRYVRSFAYILLIAEVAWLTSPMFSSVHLEGYTANLQTLSILLRRGTLAADYMMPMLTEYLYYTRAGVVLLLAALNEIVGTRGDLSFWLLVVSSGAVLSGALFILARRLMPARPSSVVFAISVIPGIFTASFFFNDNVVSASFAIASLAIAAVWPGAAGFFVAGLGLAYAVACRVDALALGPILVMFAAAYASGVGRFLILGVAALLGFSLTTALVEVLAHANPFDSIRIAAAIPFHRAFYTRVYAVLWFFGVAGGLLAFSGMGFMIARPRDYTRLQWAVTVYATALVAILVLRISSEVRYIYPLLSPVFVMLAAHGFERLLSLAPRKTWVGRMSAGVLLIAACSLVMPPVALKVQDGPRSLTGLLWSPVLWFRWQNAQTLSMARVQELADSTERVSRSLVITSHFNDDFLLRLRLVTAGFDIRRAEDVFPMCKGGFSVFTKGDHVVSQVRSEKEYGVAPFDSTLVRALLIRQGLSCKNAADAEQRYLTMFGRDLRAPTPQPEPQLFEGLSNLSSSNHSYDASLAFRLRDLRKPFAVVQASADTPINVLQGEFGAIPLTVADVEKIMAAAVRITNGSTITYEDYARAYRPVVSRQDVRLD